MKTTHSFLFLIGILFLLSGCSSTLRYTSEDAPPRFDSHQKIAILPVELVLKGKDYPEDWEQDKITKFEAEQSSIYQQLLYQALMRHYRTTAGIKIQSIDKTMEILTEKRFEVKDIWNEDSYKLAQLLGVDAVVRTKIEQVRYLSDRQAMSVAAATNSMIWGIPPYAYPYGGVSPSTATLRTTCAIIDGNDGKVLWKMGVKRDTQWNNPPKEVALNIFHKLARNFPYKP